MCKNSLSFPFLPFLLLSFHLFHPPSLPSSLPLYVSPPPSLPLSPSLPADVRNQLRCTSTKAMEREQMPLFKRFWRWLHDLDDLERLDTPVRGGDVHVQVLTIPDA